MAPFSKRQLKAAKKLKIDLQAEQPQSEEEIVLSESGSEEDGEESDDGQTDRGGFGVSMKEEKVLCCSDGIADVECD